MTLLGFKRQFADAVARRDKRMSIRARFRFREGQRLQLYTGLRTRAVQKLVADDPVVTSTASIRIEEDAVWMNEERLTDTAAAEPAHTDGFATLDDFIAFFRDVHGLPFTGQLVRWDWP